MLKFINYILKYFQLQLVSNKKVLIKSWSDRYSFLYLYYYPEEDLVRYEKGKVFKGHFERVECQMIQLESVLNEIINLKPELKYQDLIKYLRQLANK